MLKWKFTIYIKSHCDFPDYKDEIEAASKIDAARLFAKSNALREYTWQELLPFIELDN